MSSLVSIKLKIIMLFYEILNMKGFYWLFSKKKYNFRL
jgi:hypothetical protein